MAKEFSIIAPHDIKRRRRMADAQHDARNVTSALRKPMKQKIAKAENAYHEKFSKAYYKLREEAYVKGREQGKWQTMDQFRDNKREYRRFKSHARDALTEIARDPEVVSQISRDYGISEKRADLVGRETLIGIHNTGKAGGPELKRTISNISTDPSANINTGFHAELHWSSESTEVAPITSRPEQTSYSEFEELELDPAEYAELQKNTRQGLVLEEHVDPSASSDPAYTAKKERGSEITQVDTDAGDDYDIRTEVGQTSVGLTNVQQIGVHSASDSYLGDQSSAKVAAQKARAANDPPARTSARFNQKMWTGVLKTVGDRPNKRMDSGVNKSMERRLARKRFTKEQLEDLKPIIDQKKKDQMESVRQTAFAIKTEDRLKKKGYLEPGSSYRQIETKGRDAPQNPDDIAYELAQKQAVKNQALVDEQLEARIAMTGSDINVDPASELVDLGYEDTVSDKDTDFAGSTEGHEDIKEAKRSFATRVRHAEKVNRLMKKWENMEDGPEKDALRQNLLNEQFTSQARESGYDSTLQIDESSSTLDEPYHGSERQVVAYRDVEDPVTKETTKVREKVFDVSRDEVYIGERGNVISGTQDVGISPHALMSRDALAELERNNADLRYKLEHAGVQFDPRVVDDKGEPVRLRNPESAGGDVGGGPKSFNPKTSAAIARSSILTGASSKLKPFIGTTEAAYQPERDVVNVEAGKSLDFIEEKHQRRSLEQQAGLDKRPTVVIPAGAYVITEPGGKPVRQLETSQRVKARKVSFTQGVGTGRTTHTAYDISGGLTTSGTAPLPPGTGTQALAQTVRPSPTQGLTTTTVKEARMSRTSEVSRLIGAHLSIPREERVAARTQALEKQHPKIKPNLLEKPGTPKPTGKSTSYPFKQPQAGSIEIQAGGEWHGSPSLITVTPQQRFQQQYPSGKLTKEQRRNLSSATAVSTRTLNPEAQRELRRLKPERSYIQTKSTAETPMELVPETKKFRHVSQTASRLVGKTAGPASLLVVPALASLTLASKAEAGTSTFTPTNLLSETAEALVGSSVYEAPTKGVKPKGYFNKGLYEPRTPTTLKKSPDITPPSALRHGVKNVMSKVWESMKKHHKQSLQDVRNRY